MAPKHTTLVKQMARLEAIRLLVLNVPGPAEEFVHDQHERGEIRGYRSFAREVGAVIARIDITPKEKLANVTRLVSFIPREFISDPNDREASEYSNGYERGEIEFAKRVRRILNSPVTA
ncbi:MAG: hypothetical protein H9W81_10150 [Enterococcus sp.]|nr:hypothetical protein [Enterococcus sp.]